MSAAVGARTVQGWLDELPLLQDGTHPRRVPLTRMQSRIWALCSAGKFFEGLVVFMTGVALPLIGQEFAAGPTQKGMVTAASLLGILIGATALGGLSDRVGRKRMFLVEMALFSVFLTGVAVSPSLPVLIACLFGMGLALGCDYPTAHLMISESIPSGRRGRLVLSAFAFQSVGAFVGTFVGLLILQSRDSVQDWRWMFAVAIVPAVLVTLARFSVSQSPHWLVSRGQIIEAEHALGRLLARSARYLRPAAYHLIHPSTLHLPRLPGHPTPTPPPSNGGVRALFRSPHRRATVLASVPWFLQDLGTYGIGIFTPVIVAATVGAAGGHGGTSVTETIHEDVIGTEGAAVIDVLLIVGILGAILFADRVGRIRLQILGFLGCAVGLAIAATATLTSGTAQTVLVFAGFMVFNVMTNLGPNAMTYLIAGEVFPTHIRGVGAGFAASAAKVGAVATAFLFPTLLQEWGTTVVLCVLIGTSVLGAVVTWRFRIETAGINLETVGQESVARPAPTLPPSVEPPGVDVPVEPAPAVRPDHRSTAATGGTPG